MEKDLGFNEGDKWFRVRSVALIIKDNKILLVKNETDPYCYTVGGGVHHNESSLTCVKREVKEEIGLDLEVERLVFVNENFFIGSSANIKGIPCHLIEFYYLMKTDSLLLDKIVCESSTTDQIKEYLYWLDIDKLDEHIVYPVFLKDKLKELPENFEHLITYE